MRVTLFITCFNDTLFPRVGIATTQVLERHCGGTRRVLPGGLSLNCLTSSSANKKTPPDLYAGNRPRSIKRTRM